MAAVLGLLLTGFVPLLGFAAAVIGLGYSVRAYRHSAGPRWVPLSGAVIASIVIIYIVGNDVSMFLTR